MHKLFILVAFIFMLAACDPSRVYETNKDFQGALWPAGDTAIFTFSIEDTTARYHVILNLRNSIDFETARLFLNYRLMDSTSKTLRKRLLEHPMFDKKSGKPFGDSGLGNVYEHNIPLETNIGFPTKGNYTAKLNHMMRMDTLPEILSVGIRVERAGQ